MKYERVILYALVVILLFLRLQACDKVNTLQDIQTALNDTLLQTRNKAGQQVSTISVLQTEREKDFVKLRTSDSTVSKLQKVVKDYKGKLQSATIAGTTTTDSGKTITIVRVDTVLINGVPELKPVYSTTWNEKWSEGSIEAHFDTITRNIKTKNEFIFTHGTKRNLFKKDVLKVEMTNLNPNTVTTELRSYAVSMPKKRFSIGLGCTYGYSLTTYKPDAVIGLNASFILFGF